MSDPPRLVPARPLPPYSFVPGHFPHPVSDPAGHSYGHKETPPPPLDPEHWQDSIEYLHGLDLFNHGYYWEAHEAWEGLWRATGRTGPLAGMLKGLIKLAAAGVKVRQGMPAGVRSHARRAWEHFDQVAAALPADQSHYLGLVLSELQEHASRIAAHPPTSQAPPSTPVERVFDFILTVHLL